MVLIEALACGSPLVSYDCQTGPSEIINHNHNGILVYPNSIVKLSKAIDKMCLDKEFYENCKNKAKLSVNHLDLKSIKNEWQKFTLRLQNDKV